MWKFFLELLLLAKEKKWGLFLSIITAVTLGGVTLAGAKAHNSAVKNIKTNTKHLKTQHTTQVEMVATLKAMQTTQEAQAGYMKQTAEVLKNLTKQVQSVDDTNRDVIKALIRGKIKQPDS